MFLRIYTHCCCLVVKSCMALCDPTDCSTPGLPVLHYFPEFAHTNIHWVSDAIQPSHLCHALFILLSIFPSIRVFSDKSALCIRWSKYWSFSFTISPSNEYSGIISFRMDWLDLLTVQGTLKSPPAPHGEWMKFSRQEYWRGLPFPSPGDLPNPGMESRSPALQADSLPSEPPGKPIVHAWMWWKNLQEFESTFDEVSLT